MTQVLETPKSRWTPDRFQLAWEAGAFDGERVELLDGEVVTVPIGRWHSDTTMLLPQLLPSKKAGATITGTTLPSGSSLPDPDVWVRRAEAQPKEQLSKRIFSWNADDVFLVIDVSDETKMQDLTAKARLYGSTNYPEYWVVTQEAVYVHQKPTATGYDLRVTYHPGQQIPVPYAPGETVDVSELLSADSSGDDH